MRQWRFLILSSHLFFLGALLLFSGAQAGAAVFILDSTHSHLTLSGKISGYSISEQSPGSLTTAYAGNMKATISGSTIQFTGSSTIAAIINGVWLPGVGGVSGSGPADYGAQAFIPPFYKGYGAGRNISLDLVSPLLNLTGTNFDSSKVLVSMPTNAGATFDYLLIGNGGSVPLFGTATNAIATGSSISTNSGMIQLVVQVNMTITGTNSTQLTLTGTLTATNSLSALQPPVITSLLSINHNFVLTVSNATAQSQLFGSTNLTTWAPAPVTTNWNGGFLTFTTSMSNPRMFFRVEK